jgi:hypothetical protein
MSNEWTASYKGDLVFRARDTSTTINQKLRLSNNGDISFYEDTGTTAKFFWSAADEALGLGTASPSTLLHLDAASDGRVARFGSGTSDTGGMYVTHNSGSTRSFELSADNILILDADRSNSRGSSRLQFNVDGSEAMRIGSDGSCRWTPDGTNPDMTLDASGNLLVGKTSTAFGTDGTHINSSGYLEVTNTSGELLYLNRLSGNGDLIRLFKDSAVVGSIGTHASNITIGTGATGLRFYDDDNVIMPRNPSTGASVNGTISLGEPLNRFNNLYLSGGVYLGGTGSANKLEDYEEGTWTPILKDGAGSTRTLSFAAGRYTIIGRIVHVQANMTRNDTGGTDGDLSISGLPFTSTSSDSAFFINGAMWIDNGGPSTGLNDSVGFGYLGTNSTTVLGLKATNQGQNADTRYFQYQHLTNGRPIYLDLTYII